MVWLPCLIRCASANGARGTVKDCANQGAQRYKGT
jgi:hypothetical protein